MTTNSPNPVDGDVQALIAWLEEGIICSSDYGFTGNVLKSMQIALAALTAEPVAYTDAEELETLRNGTFADMFTPHESYKADQLWIPLYTAPPAQLLRPVELPDEPEEPDCPDWIVDKFSWKCGAGWMRDEVQRLNATAQPVSDGCKVPEGWKLVPIEPTDEMLIEGFESEPDEGFSGETEWEKYQSMSGCEQAKHRARLCWCAMLAAVPGGQDEQ